MAGDPCDDQNDCTAGDECTANGCVGVLLADGTPCLQNGVCIAGACLAVNGGAGGASGSGSGASSSGGGAGGHSSSSSGAGGAASSTGSGAGVGANDGKETGILHGGACDLSGSGEREAPLGKAALALALLAAYRRRRSISSASRGE